MTFCVGKLRHQLLYPSWGASSAAAGAASSLTSTLLSATSCDLDKLRSAKCMSHLSCFTQSGVDLQKLLTQLPASLAPLHLLGGVR